MAGLLPTGIYPQIYLDAIQGKDAAAKNQALDTALGQMAVIGCPGVFMHGFPKSLPQHFDALAQLATQHGLKSYAAFGLDAGHDSKAKGEAIAHVATMTSCSGVAFDMEGKWEDEATDKADAVTMGKAFRTLAPSALSIDQPWFLPSVHLNFPWVETAQFIDVRAPQVYVNQFQKKYGNARYREIWKRYEVSWNKLETNTLGPKNLIKPRIVTIEGYGWVFSDLVDCLCNNPVVILWCEPFPTSDTVLAIRAFQELKKKGFNGATAVRDFQTSAHIKVDGICGPQTLGALGIS